MDPGAGLLIASTLIPFCLLSSKLNKIDDKTNELLEKSIMNNKNFNNVEKDVNINFTLCNNKKIYDDELKNFKTEKVCDDYSVTFRM